MLCGEKETFWSPGKQGGENVACECVALLPFIRSDSRKKHALVIIIIILFLHEVFHHKNTVKSFFAKQYNGAPSYAVSLRV